MQARASCPMMVPFVRVPLHSSFLGEGYLTRGHSLLPLQLCGGLQGLGDVRQLHPSLLWLSPKVCGSGKAVSRFQQPAPSGSPPWRFCFSQLVQRSNPRAQAAHISLLPCLTEAPATLCAASRTCLEIVLWLGFNNFFG